MNIEVFLKSGLDIADGAESAAPYIIHFVMDTGNIRFAHDKAKILLKAVDRNAGRDFANDTERAEYLIADTIAANAHTDQQVMQAIAFILVYLCTDTPERLTALAAGDLAKVGYLLIPADLLSPGDAEDDGKLFRFRRVAVPVP